MDRVLQALGLQQDPARAREALRTQVAERLLENEALHGDKTDDEYGDMLDSALARLDQLAAQASNPGDPATADAIYAVLARALRPSRAQWQLRSGLAERAHEAVLDNEALRGDLDDSQYGPILNQALERLNQAADTVQNPGTAAARAEMERAVSEVSRWVRAQVRACA